MNVPDPRQHYEIYVHSRLSEIIPFLERYALGDFTRELKIPDQKDEFTELLVGISLMVEDIRDLIKEQEQTIKKLEEAEQSLDRERVKLQSQLNGIEDVIYVSDPDSYQLLFMNETALQIWGEGNVGKKCYEVLQNREEPCPFCTNELIFGEDKGLVYTWEFQNEVTGRWFRCADKAIPWEDGKLVRFELASDITDEKSIQKDLEQNLDDLQCFKRLAVDREKKMIELKHIINHLSEELNREKPYDLSFAE